MKKVGVCGAFGDGPESTGGQPVKTKMLIEGLTRCYGEEQVEAISTYHWKKRPLQLIAECIGLVRRCENIIILPAHNGLKVFSLLFFLLNLFAGRKLHYVVIGGWLSELLKEDRLTKAVLHKFKGIYVETSSMKRELRSLGFENIHIVNNFKELDKADVGDMVMAYKEPYQLIYFSRIVKEKGIEDAVHAVEWLNDEMGREVFHLDVYGLLTRDYEEYFFQLIDEAPDYITYKGLADPGQSVNIMKHYFAQIFPTLFRTEGIPGSIIDSYFAGVPVISSRWNSYEDVIEDMSTGIGYEIGNVDDLKKTLMRIMDDPKLMIDMKAKCLKKADEYSPDVVMNQFVTYL